MAVSITQPDYFNLQLNNFVVSPYEKNGDQLMGRLPRGMGNGFIEEVLVRPDLTGISGTINSVIIRYTIVNAAALDPVGSNEVVVYEENLGPWTDDGSTQPVWNTFPDTSWINAVAIGPTMSTSDTGVKTIASTPSIVALFQDWINVTKNNDGIIMYIPFNTFAFNLLFNTIEIEVDYTPGLFARRKIITI